MPGFEAVRLRPWSVADADDLQAAYRASADLARQLGHADLRRLDACRAFLTEQLRVADGTRRNFAVEEDGRAVGNVGISHIEHQHGTGWVHYWLASNARGRGLATAALTTLAGWAFTSVGLFRLELGHRVDNVSSCAVARRAGFPAEGVQRAKLADGDLRFDVESHARLVTDPVPAGPDLPLDLA